MTTPTVVRGTNDKPAASLTLVETFGRFENVGGQLFIGYPIIGSADGRFAVDALYISPTKGLVAFDLVEGTELQDFEDRQDIAATRLQQRLLGYKELVRRRQLLIPISTITFAPALPDRDVRLDPNYPCVNPRFLDQALDSITWEEPSSDLYDRAVSAIQSISTIRRARTARTIENASSRGAKLQRLEASIATLDDRQSTAVIETVEGVQRLRGLAGSGKTIVLALKAAYLHAQHPGWRIAVTFNTRSLKGQFRNLINNFVVEQTGEEPDWSKIRVVHAWGAPGGGDRDGLFYEFCTTNGATYRDFSVARGDFGRDKAFEGACAAALSEVSSPKASYDAILLDEAQDLPVPFLRMCYFMLDEHRRLVYAYDELQTLSGEGLPSAAEIFGADQSSRPLVTFDDPRRDIVLEKCYRNSRPVLVTAHGLGFGIYRTPPRQPTTGLAQLPGNPLPQQTSGLVQMFDQPSLWTDIGYHIKSGSLSAGSHVTLIRTEDTSPKFLEEHSSVDDLIQFYRFDTKEAQDIWTAGEIERNLREDELRYDDIVVINTDPVRTRANLGTIRKLLLDRGIANHLAGVDTVADVFFQPGRESITFSGVYRAKGNEAGMVYIVNADECQASSLNLARVRNRLFTAITRSKAWVRVLGVGSRMQELQEEFARIRASNFELSFMYPTAEERESIQVIHRDMTHTQQQDLGKRIASVEGILEDLETGKLYREDLDPDVLERLARILKGSNGSD
jgi:superfamily I DNA and RNA helicase